MDYSRREVSRRLRDLKSTSGRVRSKIWIGVFRVFIVALVAVGIVAVMAGFGAFKGILSAAPTVYLEDLQSTSLYSTTYYSDGTVAQRLYGAEANRIEATIDEIPIVVQRSFVALEDERFYEHNGIDFRGILRAGVSVLEEGGLNYGGSTITQQLIKNLVFSGGNEPNTLDKIERKIQEQYLAIQLEMTLSKDEILVRYLNFVNMGNGAFGIKTAAESYFGKDISEITLSEAAVLAPIVLAPTNLNPLTHPDRNAERRKSCLDNMLKMGYCTREEYVAALDDDVYTRIAEYNATKKKSNYSYFTDELIEQVLADLQSKCGYTYDQAKNLLYYGGIRIYTTQDREAQQIVDKYYTNEANFPAFGFTTSTGSAYELTYELSIQQPDGTWVNYHRSDLINYYKNYADTDGLYFHSDGKKKGISELTKSSTDIFDKIDRFAAAMNPNGYFTIEKKYLTPQPQSSFSIIDHTNGHVIALYGGRGEKTGSLTLNRASNTTRQVGSTFKVLASFLPALDSGGLTLAHVEDDAPYFYPDTDKEVVNWYTTGFRGLQSIRSGISASLNIVAVKVLDKVGPEVAFSYLEKLGFTTLVRAKPMADGSTYTDINLSLALGGITSGVTNVELTSAYGAIANGGIYNSPIYYTRIEDKDGNTIIENKGQSNQVMKTSTAWLLTSAMIDCVKSGTGTRLKFQSRKMTVAGKTGTATKNNDLWFVGFTPYYTASVWSGFDSFYYQKNKVYQQELWRNIMEEIHISKGLMDKSFEMPDSVVTAKICTKCGKLAVDGICDKAQGGSCVKTEYFAKGTVPTEYCDCHAVFQICKKSGKLATQYCPASKITGKVLLIKDENYQYTDAQMLVLQLQEYSFPITTKDSGYIYRPEVLCDYHLPDGYVISDDGRILTDEEYEDELQAIEDARLAEEERMRAEEEALLREEQERLAAEEAERRAAEAAERAALGLPPIIYDDEQPDTGDDTEEGEPEDIDESEDIEDYDDLDEDLDDADDDDIDNTDDSDEILTPPEWFDADDADMMEDDSDDAVSLYGDRWRTEESDEPEEDEPEETDDSDEDVEDSEEIDDSDEDGDIESDLNDAGDIEPQDGEDEPEEPVEADAADESDDADTDEIPVNPWDDDDMMEDDSD